jgi:hypothetical protein
MHSIYYKASRINIGDEQIKCDESLPAECARTRGRKVTVLRQSEDKDMSDLPLDKANHIFRPNATPPGPIYLLFKEQTFGTHPVRRANRVPKVERGIRKHNGHARFLGEKRMGATSK